MEIQLHFAGSVLSGKRTHGEIFDFMIRDLSQHALTLSLQASATEKQVACCHRMLQRPEADPARYERVWETQVRPLDGAYEMKP